MNAVKQKSIPLLNLQAQHRHIREEVVREIIRLVDSQQFIMGEDVPKLEQEIASYSNTRFAVACGSGSDAVLLALLGLNVQPRDEILTTPYTFFATVSAITRIGAIPVFVDVESGTFNMNMQQAIDVLARRPQIKAAIPIHLFGGCADLDPLCAIARQRGVAVIEDAAQSIGAEYRGRRAGSIGEVGCLSFYPTKNLGAYGDGGMLTTNDPALCERLSTLRVHGSKRKYYHDYVGINSRLDTLQAAVLRVKLRYLDAWTQGRQKNAALYRTLLSELRVPVIASQPAPYQNRHIFNQFCILAPRRDELQAYLKENGIGTEVYYPLPLHLQPCFANLGYKPGDFPVSERLARESLALPIHSELASGDIEQVCRTIAEFYVSCKSAL